jgi:hypothetical protein
MGSRKSMLLAFGIACGFAGSVGFGAPAPCALLKEDQVSKVLGSKVGTGKLLGDKVCSWSTEPAGKTVTVTLTSAPEFAAAERPVSSAIKEEPASGLGDEAVYNTVGKLSTLSVKKGNVFFLIRAYGIPPDEIKAKERTLAEDVLAKL